ncbi:acyl-ACP desaturase [Streptomyces sp. RKAG293]|uniref:acyl-ACP desaturase n=1 Tax=Streptomyces sp. RKAG293 TaxID=2893403 RepID=UPI002033A02E|nr:acyl-ACP desaturase [Streptomyces sp. RKAG293]MCM2416563.1 acyl-ACP desaturase [Streptomyces sp. RKAG293]
MKIEARDSRIDWLRELEPRVAELVAHHIDKGREWFPHQYIPWGAGRDYDGPLNGVAWSKEQSTVSGPVRSALMVNLLTEDNLPGYHLTIASQTSRDGAWGAWLQRWTAEEDRHAISMRAYLHATRAVDPIALERARMQQVGIPAVPWMKGVLGTIAYATVQEWGTRISHRNTGALSDDPVCEQLLTRIALDENLHMVFYRELMRAALAIDPDPVLCALDDTVREFRMPGAEISSFARMTAEMAIAGVYDLRIHHDDVLIPMLRSLEIFELGGLGPVGEQARERIAGQLTQIDERARRFTERRAQARAARAQRADGTEQPYLTRTGEA